MYEKFKLKIEWIIPEIIKIEKYLGVIYVAISCIFNIVWLFKKLTDCEFKWPTIATVWLKVFSVIWIAGFLLYVFSILFLRIGRKGKKSYGIRLIALTAMTVEIFWNHWLLWKEIPLTIMLTVLVTLLYFDGIITRDSLGINSNGQENNIFQYRDDRKYLPTLISGIKSLELRKRTANEVGTFVYSAYKYKRRFYGFTFLSISLPAVVVALNSIENIKGDTTNVVISLLSMITVIVTGFMSTMKARESWIRNREYAERAKNEIFSCLMEIGEYEKENTGEKLLSLKLEELYMEEQGQWKKIRSS